MKLRPVDIENLCHPLTWIAIGGTIFWLLLLVQIFVGDR